MADRLRPLWDFDDLDTSERRFRGLLEEQTSGGERAEVLTQLARAEGLRGRFEAAEALVGEAEGLAGSSAAARARVALERGRLYRSRGEASTALPLFEHAFAVACEGANAALAADAAHMAALAASDAETFLAWTQRGVELARRSEDADVRYWLGPLLNNLGWHHYDSGELSSALAAFQRALAERERDAANAGAREIARYAVAKTLRTLGRPDEAVTLIEQAVAWAVETGKPDGWFHEELAETYGALGREADAREQARRALPLLARDDPAFVADVERAARLRVLAA